MVYLYSIVSGFRAILGSVALQFAMALCVLIFVQTPTEGYLEEPEPGDNAKLEENLDRVKVLMVFTHFFCAASIIASQSMPTRYYGWI
jgi:hypothetical protein